MSESRVSALMSSGFVGDSRINVRSRCSDFPGPLLIISDFGNVFFPLLNCEKSTEEKETKKFNLISCILYISEISTLFR